VTSVGSDLIVVGSTEDYVVNCCFSYHYKSLCCDIHFLLSKSLGHLLPGAPSRLPLGGHSTEKKRKMKDLLCFGQKDKV